MNSYIYKFRDVNIILDSDLADLYECKNGTKEINQIVKNNIEYFTEIFSFVLNDKESENLLVIMNDQKRIVNKRGGKYKNPRVFTKEGVLLLSSFIKSDNAKIVNNDLLNYFDENEVIPANPTNIRDLIYEIDGKQVMLDTDLAILYQVETKRINEAVNNNPDKFPERYLYKINENKYLSLKSKISTSKGGSRKGHNAFTEQGVYMLSTILKSKVATNVTLSIMDTFVKMKHYINILPNRVLLLEEKVDDNTKRINELFNKFDKETLENNYLLFEGGFYDDYSLLLDILNKRGV